MSDGGGAAFDASVEGPEVRKARSGVAHTATQVASCQDGVDNAKAGKARVVANADAKIAKCEENLARAEERFAAAEAALAELGG